MAEVSKTTDWVDKEPPKADSGDNFFANPQLKPFESAIPEGKDWNATNDTGPETTNKGSPMKNVGAGYCD